MIYTEIFHLFQLGITLLWYSFAGIAKSIISKACLVQYLRCCLCNLDLPVMLFLIEVLCCNTFWYLACQTVWLAPQRQTAKTIWTNLICKKGSENAFDLKHVIDVLVNASSYWQGFILVRFPFESCPVCWNAVCDLIYPLPQRSLSTDQFQKAVGPLHCPRVLSTTTAKEPTSRSLKMRISAPWGCYRTTGLRPTGHRSHTYLVCITFLQR